MRFGGTVIELSIRRTFKHSRALGVWIGDFNPTLFTGAEPGMPISYINYSAAGLWFWIFSLMIALRVPPRIERKRRGM